jgi:hypothetical protein
MKIFRSDTSDQGKSESTCSRTLRVIKEKLKAHIGWMRGFELPYLNFNNRLAVGNRYCRLMTSLHAGETLHINIHQTDPG